MPRNIATDVSEIDNVYVYDIDDLNAVVDQTFGKRKGEIAKAETLIDSVVEEFADWQYARVLTPTFENINKNFREINEAELAGFMKRQLNQNSEDPSLYADHITNKFIRLMIKNVKSITDNGRKKEYIHIMNDLFKMTT